MNDDLGTSTSRASPKSQIVDAGTVAIGAPNALTEKVRIGQRLVLWASVVYLVLAGVSTVSPISSVIFGGIEILDILGLFAGTVAALAVLPILVISLTGMFFVWSGLQTPVGTRVAMVILLLIPLIGVVALLSVNASAKHFLHSNGYRVGFFGASIQPHVDSTV
jgi:hypothetical protein